MHQSQVEVILTITAQAHQICRLTRSIIVDDHFPIGLGSEGLGDSELH